MSWIFLFLWFIMKWAALWYFLVRASSILPSQCTMQCCNAMRLEIQKQTSITRSRLTVNTTLNGSNIISMNISKLFFVFWKKWRWGALALKSCRVTWLPHFLLDCLVVSLFYICKFDYRYIIYIHFFELPSY